MTKHLTSPRIGIDDTGQQLQGCCFAGTIGAQERNKLSLLDRQINIANGVDFAVFTVKKSFDRSEDALLFLVNSVGLAEVFDFDRGHRPSIGPQVRPQQVISANKPFPTIIRPWILHR
jgi:hypothetical protein